MKVLIFSTYFLPVIGGVQTYVRLLAQGFSESRNGNDRIEVTLVTETPGVRSDDAAYCFPIIRKPGPGTLRKLILESDVVLIAGPSLLPMILAWWSGKPFIVEQHGYQAVCPNGMLFLQPEKRACPGHFMMRHYRRCVKCRAVEVGVIAAIRSLLLTFPRRWLCNRAVANIGVTDHVRVRLSLNNAFTIRHGIENAPEHMPSGAEVLSGDPLRIAYVGRLIAEKGVFLLLQAARRLKEQGSVFHLLVVGDGPERSNLEKLARDLDLESVVQFAGDLRNEALTHAVLDISLLVMPSICEETAGLAAIEHMMRGGVVIATDIGGLSEVVGDAGLKFPPHDWEALANCIQTLISHPDQRIALGKIARHRAQENFALERMVREHVDLLAGAVRGRVAHSER